MNDDPLFSRVRDGAVCFPVRRAVVRVQGADARGFLHRMSTQHVETLTAGEARLNALTTKQGRLVDVVHHVNLADDDVLLIGTKEEGAPLVEWLDGFLFVEKVTLTDLTAAGALDVVVGGGAAGVLATLGAVPDAPWAMEKSGERIVVRSYDVVSSEASVPSFLLWDPSLDADALTAELTTAGAQTGALDELEALRVATGVPGLGEVSERYNPLELALHDAIHWAKGCYIGQEVIARIDNYGKQARQLVGLVVDDAEGLVAGAEVRLEGKPVGEVTSVSPRPTGGRPSALAVVKLKGDFDGVALEVMRGDTVVSAVARRRPAEQIPHD